MEHSWGLATHSSKRTDVELGLSTSATQTENIAIKFQYAGVDESIMFLQ